MLCCNAARSNYTLRGSGLRLQGTNKDGFLDLVFLTLVDFPTFRNFDLSLSV